jgi:predicted dehydrogenase
MKRLAVIGFGNIAPKHMEVLRALDCEVVAAVNRSPEGHQRATGEGGIPVSYDSVAEMMDRARPDGVVCCPTFDQIYHVAKELIPYRVPLLLEKPAGTSLEEFDDLCRLSVEYQTPVMVGLNRRHYSVVRQALAEIGGFCGVRAVFVDWSEDPAHLRRRGFSDDQIGRWVFGNSIHGLDLLTYLAGAIPDPQISTLVGEGDFAWYMGLVGQSERGALGSFRSSWGSPGRWRLDLCGPDRRYVFAPLETCEVHQRGVAKPQALVPDQRDQQFKPGFWHQAESLLKMIDQGFVSNGYGLESARPAMSLADKLTQACLEKLPESAV